MIPLSMIVSFALENNSYMTVFTGRRHAHAGVVMSRVRSGVAQVRRRMDCVQFHCSSRYARQLRALTL